MVAPDFHEGKEKPIPDEGDGSCLREFVFLLTLLMVRNSVDEVACLHLYRCSNLHDFSIPDGFHPPGSTEFKVRT